VIDFTQADLDDFRGAEWMRSLPAAEHAAIPIQVANHVFRASCRCSKAFPLYRPARGERIYPGLNTNLWLKAAADADKHMQEHAS
jgi:hypothetical protein